ncbi:MULTISPECIES: DUF1707 domain-containing protein [unclassified Nocardia]|uniref:DUF1707 SHOCT-like domain-containing protein n=1 Tax=unclassified Nocardia TaxID=2637762 RepID=UPI001CE457B3|nr:MULTISPECIES: DUF1707 domain-containing protein [unclassified Nocardia]
MADTFEPRLPAQVPQNLIGDTDRELAARQLQRAVEEGRIDLFELDKRLVAVYAARTSTELVAVTADLPAPVAEPLELRTGSGSREKVGSWIVPSEITLEVRSGSIKLDFTEAFCPHTEVTVRVKIGSGSLLLLMPRGWQVELDRIEVRSGDLKSKVTEPRQPGAPLLRFEGQVGSGSVLARYPRPPRRSFWAWLLRRPRPVA